MAHKRPSPVKRFFYGLGALVSSWVGLGMLGVVSGWHNIDTATAKIFGIGFLIASFFLIRTVIDPGPPTDAPAEPPPEDEK